MPKAHPRGVMPRFRVVPLVFAVAAAALPMSAAPARAGASGVPGIDVSQYQNAIDWPSVSHRRAGFVIMRATKGSSEVDTEYATNLAGATGNGFIVGSYHRATPSSAPGDAVAEADQFVAVARN